VATVPWTTAIAAKADGTNMELSMCTWASIKPGRMKGRVGSGPEFPNGRMAKIRSPINCISTGWILRLSTSTRLPLMLFEDIDPVEEIDLIEDIDLSEDMIRIEILNQDTKECQSRQNKTRTGSQLPFVKL
jgi:hypothetical protein